ncbi:saccharopine dehydrogenase family protein [Candidatus Albibeggiatoa sp. nov. BB20]|uniref:saccharopine dehydrogenase family protein n=1 Tax=Candidatus Albibeggiatoa sp. nov. BB20 TaxID=3162723 RepID=UPI00336598C5
MVKKNVLIIGAGGVAHVVAHKCAQHNDILGDICIASRTLAKCESIIESVHRKNNLKNPQGQLYAKQLDVMQIDATVNLIKATHSQIVINVASSFANLQIIDACLQAEVDYIDTSVCEIEGIVDYIPYCRNWYEEHEWARKAAFKQKGLTSILSIGFDPGVVNAYCAYALKHEFDKIKSIDILDVNAGSHGKFFATNFDPEINLLEVDSPAGYWENRQWKEAATHSKSITKTLPVVGEHILYLMSHDEVHSLSSLLDVDTVRFWMGFGEQYLNSFNVLKNLGLLSFNPVTTAEGQEVIPIKVLKACLPEPSSLAENYTGKTCIGNLIKGEQAGQPKTLFIYNICDHEQCYAEVEAQAISYTAGVPPVAAAILIATGEWEAKTMVNVEQLDPDPLIKLLDKIGLPTQIQYLDEDEHVIS